MQVFEQADMQVVEETKAEVELVELDMAQLAKVGGGQGIGVLN